MAANPNTIPMQTTWTKEYQDTHAKIPVYPAITNYRLKKDLKKGDTVKRTYARQFVANDMGGGGEFSRQTIVDTEESLEINKEKETSFYVKKLDELQSHLPTQERHARGASMALHQQIDADVLGEYANMNSALDAASFAGTSGNGIEITSSNIPQVFSNVTILLQRANIMVNVASKFTAVKLKDMEQENMGVAVISPNVYGAILERLDGKDSALGDSVGVQGHVGKYMGYQLFVSNALTWTGTLYMATNPTDGDTVSILGVTYTFKATLGSTAGNIHIASTVDITRANFAEAINNPSTTEAEDTDTGYVALGTTPDANGFSDQDKLKNVTATNDNTADTISIVAKGKGHVVVAETFTAAADGWTAAKQIQHCLIGVAGAIDLVIQQEPELDVRKRDGYVGRDVVTWCAYGVKTFNDGKPRLVDVKVRTDAFSGSSTF